MAAAVELGTVLGGLVNVLDPERVVLGGGVIAGDPDPWVEACAAEMARGEFGLDDVLFQGFEVRDGRLTGEPTHPICYSHGKVEVAEAWARANDIDLGATSYYTDSSTDLPMLERVGRPFAVHPDPRLARIAQARGWPVLDWRTGGA